MQIQEFSRFLSPPESSHTAILSSFSYAPPIFLMKFYTEDWAEGHSFRVLCDSQQVASY